MGTHQVAQVESLWCNMRPFDAVAMPPTSQILREAMPTPGVTRSALDGNVSKTQVSVPYPRNTKFVPTSPPHHL